MVESCSGKPPPSALSLSPLSSTHSRFLSFQKWETYTILYTDRLLNLFGLFVSRSFSRFSVHLSRAHAPRSLQQKLTLIELLLTAKRWVFAEESPELIFVEKTLSRWLWLWFTQNCYSISTCSSMKRYRQAVFESPWLSPQLITVVIVSNCLCVTSGSVLCGASLLSHDSPI